MSAKLLLLIIVSILATATLSGIFGMAGGLILMGVYMTLLPTVAQAMVLHGVTQVASNGFRCFLLRKHIYWKGLAFYGVGALVSFAIFWAARVVLEKNYVFLLLGALPLLQIKLRPSFMKPTQGLLCGLVVTSAHLTAGVSGPLLDIFFLDGKLTRHQVIATKAFTQTFSHCLKIVYFGSGILGTAGAQGLPSWLFPTVVIAAFVGTTIGRRILDSLTDHGFLRWSRRIVTTICLVFLVRGILGLIGQ